MLASVVRDQTCFVCFSRALRPAKVRYSFRLIPYRDLDFFEPIVKTGDLSKCGSC